MQRQLLLFLFVVLAAVFMSGCSTAVHPPPNMSALYDGDSLSEPAKYDFYDSKGNRFAIVTLMLPFPIMSDPFDGEWSGTLDKSYVRPKTDYVLPSDKLNVPHLCELTCKSDSEHPSEAIINLNPNMPDDYIVLFLPLPDSGEPITGHWVYATDGGEVDSGTFSPSSTK